MELVTFKNRVVEILEACKGQDITTIDVRAKTSVADYLIIASGSSQRHVISMSDHVYTQLKSLTPFLRKEGEDQGNWVLIDGGDIIIHLFKTEVRQFYDLEKLWLTSQKEPALLVG